MALQCPDCELHRVEKTVYEGDGDRFPTYYAWRCATYNCPFSLFSTDAKSFSVLRNLAKIRAKYDEKKEKEETRLTLQLPV